MLLKRLQKNLKAGGVMQGSRKYDLSNTGIFASTLSDVVIYNNKKRQQCVNLTG